MKGRRKSDPPQSGWSEAIEELAELAEEVVESPFVISGLWTAMDTMRAMAIAAAPREACALIVKRIQGEAATSPRELALVPVRNLSDRNDLYSIDPESQARFGDRIVGVWHSHVFRDAEMSGMDIAMAQPGLLYVIYSLRDNVVRSWRCDTDGTFLSVKVRIM